MDRQELKSKLDAGGYDVEELERLGGTLGIDLLNFLAVWSTVLIDLSVSVEPPRRRRWWQFWRRR